MSIVVNWQYLQVTWTKKRACFSPVYITAHEGDTIVSYFNIVRNNYQVFLILCHTLLHMKVGICVLIRTFKKIYHVVNASIFQSLKLQVFLT